MEILRCLSNIGLYTKMLRMCSIFTIKAPQGLTAPAPFGLLIVKTLKYIPYYTITYNCIYYFKPSFQ